MKLRQSFSRERYETRTWMGGPTSVRYQDGTSLINARTAEGDARRLRYVEDLASGKCTKGLALVGFSGGGHVRYLS